MIIVLIERSPMEKVDRPKGNRFHAAFDSK